jgi:beta-glucanase (GH16 family)
MLIQRTGALAGGIGFAILMTIGIVSPAAGVLSLVWSDEFDGSSLNTSDWTIDIGDGCPNLCGWGNNELEYYRAENVSVTGGNLVLTARQENYGGRYFTSGKVHTRNKQSFLYGRMEMRAKIPTGGGMWPAFWMMPQDDVYGGWASSGEIDIMESANNTDYINGTIHYGGTWPDNTHSGGTYSQGGVNFADEFHTYAVEWEPEEIRWYVDGQLYATRYSWQWYSNGAPSNPLAPFDQEFYIILNAAVGGNYTGCTTPGCITADLPQEYIIDYVRVYQDTPNLAPTVAITYPTATDEVPAGDIIITADASDPDGEVIGVEFYTGTTLLGVDSTFPYTYTWTSVADGCYTIAAKAFDDGGAVSDLDTVDITVGTGCGQAPYPGSPFVLPGVVEAEDFDIGGEGVAYHDTDTGNNGNQYRTSEDVDIEACSDVGGGYNVGWIPQGEWLEYTIDVPVPGVYPIEIRVACQSSAGTFHIEFNGANGTGDVEVPITGGWQTWETVSTSATLAAGTQRMKFVVTDAGFNLNSFTFLQTTSAVLPGPVPENFALHPCYPNPFNPRTTITFDLPREVPASLRIFDVSGRLVDVLLDDESASPGRHEVVWRGRDLSGRAVPAGIYLYRLEAGSQVVTKSMTLLK